MQKIGNLYFHGSRNKDVIALSFDDGPSEETEKVLDLLKQYDAKATFFVWGQRIKGREKTIERIIQEGHEIGNHSFHHYSLWFKSKKVIEQEISQTDREFEKFNIKTLLFRPPHFRTNFNLIRTCKKLNKKIIYCDVVSNDWMKRGVEYSVKRILKKTKKSSVLNFHDYLQGIGRNEKILPILKKVLPKLRERYKLITISKLLDL